MSADNRIGNACPVKRIYGNNKFLFRVINERDNFFIAIIGRAKIDFISSTSVGLRTVSQLIIKNSKKTIENTFIKYCFFIFFILHYMILKSSYGT